MDDRKHAGAVAEAPSAARGLAAENWAESCSGSDLRVEIGEGAESLAVDPNLFERGRGGLRVLKQAIGYREM